MDRKLVTFIILFAIVVLVSAIANREPLYSFKPKIAAEGGGGGISIDRNPPAISNIQESIDPVIQNNDIIITANITDNNGILLAKIELDNNAINYDMVNIGGNIYQATIDTSDLSIGTHNYLVFAQDVDGWNVRSANYNFVVQQQTVGPLSINNLVHNSDSDVSEDYTISYDSLNAGSLMYVDRTYSFGYVPSIVQDKTYVVTANDDKNYLNFNMNFDVNQPVTVFIGYDAARIPIQNRPSWINNGWLDTGEDLNLGSTPHRLYAKNFSTGNVALGSNIASNPPSGYDMYNVVVVPLGESGGSGSVCGNTVCEADETEASCPQDCSLVGGCNNNGICEVGENSSTCPNDCPVQTVCGDLQITGNEVCDSVNLNGQSCITQGFDAGTLSCSSDCLSFDTAGCYNLPDQVCGNGVVEGSEQCDSSNLNGESCTSLGYTGGSLNCNAPGTANECQFNTSACTTSSGSCSLTSAAWSATQVQEGTYLTLTVNGNNCNGQQVDIEWFEDDGIFPRDTTGITKSFTFTSSTQATTKMFAKWLDDTDGVDADPEYKFVAKLNSNPSINTETSNTLKVTQVNAIGLIGNRLPGDWRPFSDNSLWNTPIESNPIIHPESNTVINFATTQSNKIRFSNVYMPPIWVVDSDRMPQVYAHSSTNIYDYWDEDWDDWSDVPVPIVREMYDEPTSDGHIIIIDPFKNIAWEMSRFNWPEGQDWVDCTTFNIWNLSEEGYADYDEWGRWTVRGGRGSGVPALGGLLRPEEIASGEVKHRLAFTFPSNRMASNGDDLFIAPPAVRSDGDIADNRYPVEGMLFQLNPELTDAQFDSWGLTNEAKIVARALQTYGAYDVDKGGAMAFQPQLLGPDQASNRAVWDATFPNLYSTFDNIPTNEFRVVYTYGYSQRTP